MRRCSGGRAGRSAWAGAFFLALGLALPAPAGDGIRRYHAVLAGVADYQTISDLSFPSNDVVELYSLLLGDTARWSPSRVTMLLNAQASRTQLVAAISAMATNSDDDDLCLVYYSGHGGQAALDPPPIDEYDNKDEYLCCWDSNEINYAGDLTDDDLAALLASIPGRVVLLLDTCYSGGQMKGTEKTLALSDAAPPEAAAVSKFSAKPFEVQESPADGVASDILAPRRTAQDANSLPDIAILTACNDGESSYERSSIQHGVFTYFLLQALRSADGNRSGAVDPLECYRWLLAPAYAYETNSTPQCHNGLRGPAELRAPDADRIEVNARRDFPWYNPFSTYYKKRRTECLYRKSQVGGTGWITHVGIFVGELPGLVLSNCTIRMQHTAQEAFPDSPQWHSSGWSTVYRRTTAITNLGLYRLPLDTPFAYNGLSNLLVDFSFANTNYSGEQGLFFFAYGGYQTIFARDDDAYGAPTSWAGFTPPPIRDSNPPYADGSYLDIQFEFAHTPQAAAWTASGTGASGSWYAVSGGVYRLQGTPALDPPGWTNIGPATTATQYRVTAQDADPAALSKFYRLQRQLP